MDQRKGLERFIRQQVFRSRDNPLEKLVLKSALIGARGMEVESFPIPPDINNDNIGMLVDEVLMRAQDDANGQGTKLQSYTLLALEMGTKEGPRFPFRVRGEGDDDDEGGSEAPNEKGMIAQLMRHNEAIMRMHVMGTGQQLSSLARRLESSEATIDRLLTDRQKGLELLEAAKTHQHERDMQMLLTSGQEDRKAELIKKVELLFPLIVNKIAGQPVLPTGQQGDVFDTLANSFTSDQLNQIAPFLTQEQQLLLLTLLKAAREKQAHTSSNGAS